MAEATVWRQLQKKNRKATSWMDAKAVHLEVERERQAFSRATEKGWGTCRQISLRASYTAVE